MFRLDLFLWWLQQEEALLSQCQLEIRVNDILLSVVMISSWIFFVIVFKEVTKDHRGRQREDKQGCDRESCE